MWTAIVSHPRDGEYTAVFEFCFVEAGKLGRRVPGYPTVTIPCTGYDHARAVVDAYNKVETGR